MDSQDFKKDFLEDVKADAQATGEGSCACFVTSFADYLQNAEYLYDFNASFFEGTGKQNRKLRVDGYAYDELDKTLSLIIADYNVTDDDRIFGKTEAIQLQNRLKYFIEDAKNTDLHKNVEMSRACSDLLDFLRNKQNDIQKYLLLIFTTADISSRLKHLESPDIDGIPSECQIWDIERLFQLCGSDTGRHIIEINFKEYSPNGIPCLEASYAATEDFKSYLGIIPGTVLADIYDKYGSSLLEGNVRSFLSTKVAVNKQIRSTILRQPERFFAYNNGISVTAMNVQFESTPQGLFLVFARDFQIINGGQTTASLSNTRFRYKEDTNLEPIYVQMKLTVIEKNLEDEDVTDLIKKISESSNRQNAVSNADFFSNHPFHVQMERCSQRLGARGTGGLQFETKWFYERTRGQYLQKQMRMSDAQKRKFELQHPKKQLITKTDLAKIRNTWNCRPHIVSKGAQTNFADFATQIDEEWEKNGGLTFGDRYFQESVALCLLFRHLENNVPRQKWYQKGYRANIVTYTLAFLHHLIKSQYPKQDLNLLVIWTRQAIPHKLESIIEKLSELVYYKLTDSKRLLENVTQWCKQTACWDSVKKIEYNLPDSFEEFLISQADIKMAKREEKAERKIDKDVDAMTHVVEIPAEQWSTIMNYATNKHLASADDLIALQMACQIPTKIPNPVQCKKLIALLDRLYEDGYKL